jgi:hypothetical protein
MRQYPKIFYCFSYFYTEFLVNTNFGAIASKMINSPDKGKWPLTLVFLTLDP